VKRPPASSEDHDNSSGGLCARTDDRQSSALVHTPAEKLVGRALEDGSPGSQSGIAQDVVIAGRQRAVTSAAYFFICERSIGETGKGRRDIAPHQITVTASAPESVVGAG
jgi:hypothetical protein